jgi:hypothetical protein
MTMCDCNRGIHLIGSPRPRRITRLIVATLLSVSTISLVESAAVQDPLTDIVFRNTAVRSAIAALGESLGKSVAFDRAVPEQRTISFEVRGVLKSDALAQLLQRERLFAIEIGSVLIVAPDSEQAHANYTPQRIEACRIGGHDETRGDIVLPRAPLEKGLTILAQANGRAARVDAAISRDPRAYDLELRAVTTAEALQVFCLVTHVHVRDDGDVLDFSFDTRHR